MLFLNLIIIKLCILHKYHLPSSCCSAGIWYSTCLEMPRIAKFRTYFCKKNSGGGPKDDPDPTFNTTFLSFFLFFVTPTHFSAPWCYSQIVTWKQEITNLWNRSGEIGNRIPGSCSASKNLTTTPSLFQSAWQHNSIGVNHACQVSGFWGESPDLLKMTTDDGFGNNYHKQ